VTVLDLSEMKPADRERVTDLAGGLMRDLHGTAELLTHGEKLRLTPGTVSQDGQRALARFMLALDALTDNRRPAGEG
jgi:hypothetical protein